MGEQQPGVGVKKNESSFPDENASLRIISETIEQVKEQEGGGNGGETRVLLKQGCSKKILMPKVRETEGCSYPETPRDKKGRNALFEERGSRITFLQMSEFPGAEETKS